MDTLPIGYPSLLWGIFQKRWTVVLCYVGVASLITVGLIGLTCLFTYMRVSFDYEVKIQKVGSEFAVEVQKKSVEVARLEGEILGYHQVIQAFAKTGRRKSLGTFEVTAYDLEGCKPFDDGVTSIGLPIGDGIFAVNPKEIAYGSFLHIPKINKYGIAGDTGAAMRHNPRSVDIFMVETEEAKEFGRQELEIELIQFGGN